MVGFNRKLYFGILFFMVLVLGILGSSIYSLYRVVDDQNDLIGTYTKQLLLARDLKQQKTQQISLMPIYVLRGDELTLQELNRANVNFNNSLIALSNIVKDPESKRKLSWILAAQKELEQLALPGIKLKSQGESTKDVNIYFGKVTGPRTVAILTALNDFVNHVTKAYEKEKTDNAHTSQTIIKTLAAASMFCVFLCFFVGALLLKLIGQKKEYDKNNERLAEKERELSRSRKETLEVVAHELKNPLSSIIMGTQLLLRRRSDLSGSLETTLKSAESMKRLIDDLLDHAKIESGSLVLEKKECELEPFLTSLTNRFEPMALNKNLYLKCHISPNLPSVMIDEGRMEQVISNFVGNAIKFTDNEGEIQISADYFDNNVLISVSDNGPGMTNEQANHVFERYWQARETANLGTGLGLSISKAIVQAHGGMIKVKSELGKGSTFLVSLPQIH